MSIMAISSIVFAFLLGGTLLGIAFRGALPEHHLVLIDKKLLS
jgi:hypothetical protein